MTCNVELRLEGKSYPRTCGDCKLGFCTDDRFKNRPYPPSKTNDPANDHVQFNGRVGSWMIYNHDDGLHADYISNSLIDVVKKHSSNYSYSHIGFWPFGMDIKTAVSWWTEAIEDGRKN